MFAPPAVAVVGAAALRARPKVVYWSFSCLLTTIMAAAFYFDTVDSNAASNAPIAVAAFFIAIPMLATFAMERLWFALGTMVSRPLRTIVLSIPLGILSYVFSLFVAVIIGVNVGILEP